MTSPRVAGSNHGDTSPTPQLTHNLSLLVHGMQVCDMAAREPLEPEPQRDSWQLPSHGAPIGFLSWETQGVRRQPKPPAGS